MFGVFITNRYIRNPTGSPAILLHPWPIIALLFLGCMPTAPTQAAPDERPNIIVILVDDMGWSDLGCYGGEIDTPNLDALAQGGMRFLGFHNTAKCFPSRACLLSGLYAQQTGMADSFKAMKNCVTLGETLRPAGYHTYAVGKHHCQENLYDRGFDHYYGLRDGCCNFFNPGNQRDGEGKPARKRPRFWCFDEKTLRPYTPEEKDFYTTDYFTRWAIRFLEEQKNDDKPFLLYLSYTAPHYPLHAWPRDIAKYKGRYEVGYEAIRQARYARQKKMGLIDRRYPLPPADYPDWNTLSDERRALEIKRMQVYAAMVDNLDQNIGKLIDWLKANKAFDNTLILFASDNGACDEHLRFGTGEIGTLTRYEAVGRNWANVSNTPLRRYKATSHQGGINTPLIAHWPAGGIRPGSIDDTIYGHFIDIMPTLCEIAGATYPAQYNGRKVLPVEGVSLLPAFQGKSIRRAEPMFFHYGPGRAVIHEGWKLVAHGKGPWELYHLDTDRTETNNLAEREPRRVERMAAQYDQWKARCAKQSGAEQ